jgi:hypothetical protein
VAPSSKTPSTSVFSGLGIVDITVPATGGPAVTVQAAAVRSMPSGEVPKFIGEEAHHDARVLDLELLPASAANPASGVLRVRRPGRDVCSKLSVTPFSDLVVLGPRTIEWCCIFINRRGGGPRDHHRWWMTVFSLDKTMWGVETHDSLFA